MKTLKHYCMWMLMALFVCNNASSQSADSSVKAQFKIGVNYNTGLNYFGRTDSLRSSGFFPLAELWLNESFYINAAPVFVNNSAASFEYAGTVASIGYQLHEADKWLVNFYVLKPFYKESSELVQSALKAQGGITLTRLNNIINITAGGDVKFSDKTDYGVTGGLDHIFRKQFADNTVLVIDPSAYVYAGTQQFTNTYYKKSNFLFFPGVEQEVTEEVKSFSILAYELSAPVVVAKGKFQFIFNPAYVIPQNLIEVEGRPDLSERGKNMFYATVGAKVIF